MSVIVRPTVDFLDEAFDSVDPCALRGLRNMINELKVLETSVLLTTKSMQEAEHICDKIAIIINGKVVAFGSPQYLVQSYGGGYEVSTIVDITKSDYLNAYKVITEKFNGSVSLVFQGYLEGSDKMWNMVFKVSKNVALSLIFHEMTLVA